ncbi:DUF3152 domain-containing protein [Streptomyces sp. NPDC050287]|uniref:DUF3152 domain-containing protein n=1 Tax=Streptomyces sp. NPDC050287 TaxID=3365608 RepID=UPI0037BD8BB4
MGRHSRRGPAPKTAPKGDSGDNNSDVTGGRSRTQVPPPGYGTPPRGGPRAADGTPARGTQRLPDGTPAREMPRYPDGTPAHGIPRFADGTPAHGVPQVRGGHPEQRENGGGWGEPSGRPGAGRGGRGPVIPRQRPPVQAGSGPRQDYLDAFEADADEDVFVSRTPAAGPPTPAGGLRRPVSGPRTPVAGPPAAPGSRTAFATGTQTVVHASEPYDAVTVWPDAAGVGGGDDDDAAPTGEPAEPKGGKGRTFTGIVAAAVVTVLAIVVAGQVADGRDGGDVRSRSATDQARDDRDSASRVGERPVPSGAAAAPLTYQQKMDRTYALGATLKGSGKFDAIPGFAKAPGKGQKFTYRVDVEQGLGLDGELFAEAVQKTLNDDRSWAHNGARTFERIYSGKPDFVITLASPGTTADWCAKSGLDTTVDNVSCDSAATERVMINAYRWARGSTTYGDHIYAYRQMLINHEVGHRLGNGHVSCDKDGELAPVMQQQTKFLDHDGIHCRANPWPFPGN